MYRLTQKRLDAAKDILSKYRKQLFSQHSFDAGMLELELRQIWNVGYRPLKDIMIAMLAEDSFREVAAYYMQNSNAPGPVSEFKRALAEMYGVTHYDAQDRREMQDAYWTNVFECKKTVGD
jgi:hypothetical protein